MKTGYRVILETPGDLLKCYRNAKEMTLREVAKKLGVALTVYADMEYNRRTVSRAMALKLKAFLGNHNWGQFKELMVDYRIKVMTVKVKAKWEAMP